jgi:phosphohistidine phosphatase SixA
VNPVLELPNGPTEAPPAQRGFEDLHRSLDPAGRDELEQIAQGIADAGTPTPEAQRLAVVWWTMDLRARAQRWLARTPTRV